MVLNRSALKPTQQPGKGEDTIIPIINMKLRHCLLSDTESETYRAQYTISYDVINKRKKLPNLTLLQTGQPSYNLNKL